MKTGGVFINIKQLERMELAIGSGENAFTMKRGSFKYRFKNEKIKWLSFVQKKETDYGFKLSFFDPDTQQKYVVRVYEKNGDYRITMDYVPGKNRYILSIPTSESEHIYGCGETYSKFDLKGEKVRIWVAEHQNSGRISKKIIREKLFGVHPKRVLPFSKYESYYAQPTFTSSDKYALHANTNGFAVFDFRKRDRIRLELQEPLDIHIWNGGSFEELSFKLSGLLGRQRSLPDWLYDGGILAVQEGCEAVDQKIKVAKAAGVQIKGVWCQDWSGCRRTGFGYQVMWNWQTDESLYPKLKEKIAEWKENGVRFLGYINPFLAIEKNLYKEAAEKGYCVKDKEGKDYLVTITTFPAAMVDFTNPEAYKWYKKLIKENMIGIGMSGWMADFGEYLPVDAVLYDGDPEILHNQWPAIWAKMNKEAIEECQAEDEVFFFARAGYTGTISYSSMMWTGDQHVDWSVDDGLPSVIPATLSLAMSGYGVTHSDVGGYTTIMHMRRSKELLMRWEEMNVFSPLFRSHEGNQPVNNVQFDGDEELLTHLAECVRIHADLKEYLKHCTSQLVDRGTPVMRPLFYHYDEEACYEEMSEYLLGEDILVAPVLKQGATGRRVYLPKEEWVHFFTKENYGGGTFEVQAEIGCPPVFVRKKSPFYEQLLSINK